MKDIYILFLLLAVSNSIFSQVPKTRFTITGYTFHKSGKARLLVYTNKSQFIPFDSADIENGKFIFSGTLDEPKSFTLQIRDRNRVLFIGNENIVVTEKNSKNGEITVAGSKLSNDYDYYFNKWLAPLLTRLATVNQRLDILDSTHKQEIDSLTSIQGSLFNHVPDSSAVFIKERPSSFVSLYLLNYYADAFGIDKIKALYYRLDYKLKQYPSADFIKEKISLASHQSMKCPSFSAPDTSNQLVTLQSFKGNYVLIDFWASWCVPCVKNIPFIQKAANKFRDNNFKVLTVSLDQNTSAWKTALIKYELTNNCTNVFLQNQFRNPMSLQFTISYIPYNVLVDPDGNIIDRNIDGEKLNQKLEQLFKVSTSGEEAVINIR